MSESYTGHCFCGAVSIELTGEPNVMGYCHCTDCATWAGAPINAFSLWAPESVKVTAGAEKLASFAKTEASHRKFCSDCGGHVMSEHPALGMVDVYLNVVPDKAHEPTLHIFYAEKTVSVADGLPKYADMPTEFGGSGNTLPD